MSEIRRMHPLPVFLCMAGVITFTAFAMDPIISLLSFVSVVWMHVVTEKRYTWKEVLMMAGGTLAIALVNPLFSHNGATVLFFLNGNAVTLEAILYGLHISFMIMTVLLWGRILSDYLTSDIILYLVARVSGKAALLLSLVLRLIPSYIRQCKERYAVQRSIGLFGAGSLYEQIKGGLLLFSGLVTWAMEHSVETADSMLAREYGRGRRSNYHSYRFGASDIFLQAFVLLTGSAISVGIVCMPDCFTFYPNLLVEVNEAGSVFYYIVFGLLAGTMPAAVTIGRLRWNYYERRI